MMGAGDPADRAPAVGFEFATAGRILFGPGSSRHLPAAVAALGRRTMVVTGGHPARHATLIDALRAAVDVVGVFAVASEPTVALAESGAGQARDARCETIVAIGGGSAIDAGKAIAALAANPGPTHDYLEVVGRARPLTQASLPFIAVPTTAGTGAEVTRNAVLAVPEAGVKVSLRSAHMLPRVAVIDPELTRELPPATTAATGMDALTQLIEPFLSSRANPMVDALCRDGIPRVARALPIAVRSPGDLAARSDLSLGALFSGMALANAGLGAVHGLAAPIGGRYSAPHGAVCAALLPHVLAANLEALRARTPAHPSLARFGQLAEWLTGCAGAPAEDAITSCARLVRDLHVPGLAQWGLARADLDDIATRAAAASSMKANPIPLTHDELTAVLAAALTPLA